MASIKFTSNTKNDYYAVLIVSEKSQNKSKNKTTLSYSLKLYSGYNDFSGYTIGYSVYINGSRVAYHNNSGNQTSMSKNSSKSVVSGSVDVPHNTDGTKTVNVSFKIFTDNRSYLPVSLSKSGSMLLTKIPRESKLGTIQPFDVDKEFSVPVTKYSSSFTDKLEISYEGTKVKTVNGYSSGTGISFTDTEKEKVYELMSEAPLGKGSFNFSISTYSGSERIGSDSKKVQGTISDARPKLPSFTYKDVNSQTLGLTGSESTVIKGSSNVRLTVGDNEEPQGQKGAYIVSYIINDGVPIQYKKNFSYSFEGYDKDYIKITVLDSRQNSNSVTLPVNLVLYDKVTKISCSAARENNIGEEVRFSLEGSIWTGYFDSGELNCNEITETSYSYSKNNGEEVDGSTSITLTKSDDGKFRLENVVLAGDLEEGGWDIDARYTVKIIVKDRLTEEVFSFTIESGVPAMKITGNKVTFINGLADLIYPVGSIYMSMNGISPAELFGGQWEQLKDRFLLGVGDTYTAGNTGGSANVTLQKSHMPSHTHTVNGGSHRHSISNCSAAGSSSSQLESYAKGNSANRSIYTAYDGGHTHTVSSTGGGSAHENMPPYLVVYMWQRTA